jgi:hypothetical protein
VSHTHQPGRAVRNPFEARVLGGAGADDAVVRHELGHAAVWFRLGGALGPLEFFRTQPMTLMARAHVPHRSTGDQHVPTRRDAAIERTLSGEIAARRHLGARLDRVSLGHPAASQLVVGHPIGVVRVMCDPDLNDLAKALQTAEEHHSSNWWPWFLQRHANATQHVQDAWSVIDQLAGELMPLLPARHGGTLTLLGTDLIRSMYRLGLAPLSPSHPPMEAIPRGREGGTSAWARRLWRRYVGEERTRWRTMAPIRPLAEIAASLGL